MHFLGKIVQGPPGRKCCSGPREKAENPPKIKLALFVKQWSVSTHRRSCTPPDPSLSAQAELGAQVTASPRPQPVSQQVCRCHLRQADQLPQVAPPQPAPLSEARAPPPGPTGLRRRPGNLTIVLQQGPASQNTTNVVTRGRRLGSVVTTLKFSLILNNFEQDPAFHFALSWPCPLAGCERRVAFHHLPHGPQPGPGTRRDDSVPLRLGRKQHPTSELFLPVTRDPRLTPKEPQTNP